MNEVAGAPPPRRLFRALAAALAAAGLAIAAAPAGAGPKEEVARLMPLWRANAPLCENAPSGADCHDGDMTLFNGLLCAAGEEIGCLSVKNAQGPTGRWHRSVRFARDPSLRPRNSFSWDMAIGVQLYAVAKPDKAALEKWLAWLEANRPCVIANPLVKGDQYCLVRGLPRWCTDDTERGCTAKPNDLAMLATTRRALGVALPAPREATIPEGLPRPVRKELEKLVEEAREANALLSVARLLEGTADLQPTALLIDAAVNREGYPRHLVAAEILLMRCLGKGGPEIDLAAATIFRKDRGNAFFQYLVEGPSDAVAAQLLAVAPGDASGLPPLAQRRDWTWQRAQADEAWRKAKLWDFVFLGRLLAPRPEPAPPSDSSSRCRAG